MPRKKKYIDLSKRQANDYVAISTNPVLNRIFNHRGVSKKSEACSDFSALIGTAGLSGCEEASRLLSQALQTQQAIMIIGDYDVDGATATTVAVKGFTSLGFNNVHYMVPDRFKLGYGLTSAIVEQAAKHHSEPKIIITVDNGVSSFAGAATAQSLGIKLIITDHHLPGDSLPVADAIINPQCCRDSFAAPNLAGVGVIFYYLIALRAFLRQEGILTAATSPNLANLLPYVAIGTVADLVKLDQNNRILVAQGLKRIRQGKVEHGLRALIEKNKINIAEITAIDISFKIAPKLNAAGRMDDMNIGIACMLANNCGDAHHYAQLLLEFNSKRVDIQGNMVTEALQQTGKVEQHNGICIYSASWHQGVIGILASKIKERYYCPSIIFADDEDKDFIKGSARSIAGINIRQILADIAGKEPGLLNKFGGHAMAAGLQIKKSHLHEFKQSFFSALSGYDSDVFTETIYTDGELSSSELQLSTAKILDDYGIWGQGFMPPQFSGRFLIKGLKLLKGKHIKLQLRMESQQYDAIWFFADQHYSNLKIGSYLHCCYQLMINRYLGESSLSLHIVDIYDNEDATVSALAPV